MGLTESSRFFGPSYGLQTESKVLGLHSTSNQVVHELWPPVPWELWVRVLRTINPTGSAVLLACPLATYLSLG